MRIKQFLLLSIRCVSSMLGRLILFLACLVVLSFPTFAAGAANAFVRVVHASPAAGPVDVFVDGTKLLSNFTFASTTDYVEVPAGSHNIQVSPAGKGINAAVITQTVSVHGGISYTVAAIGTMSSSFSLVAFSDDNLVSDGMAKVRVYHLSPDAGLVDVAAGGNKVIRGLTYQNASAYLTVPAGSYTFNVTATDTQTTVPVAATLASGTINSVFAVGLLKGSPKLQFVVTTIKGTPGMPGTGSDPHALPANTLLPWFLGTAALLVIVSAIVVRRFVGASQKKE